MNCTHCHKDFTPKNPVHRLLVGDSTSPADVEKLMAGAKANVVITSPPYARQREYDPASGFLPIAADEYVNWYRAVADNIASVLAPDGSYFLNIKAHAADGERNLYVMDLVIAHRRQWQWLFVDEFCWRNTANGVPGGWNNRFKNAFEPVYHFAKGRSIKFFPDAVGHLSDDVVVYAAGNPKAPSGSGLLGCGAEKVPGIARPSNVIEVKAEGGVGLHSAPFPIMLVAFFVKAFSALGDIVMDPFLGSATSMVAAEQLGRSCFGIELSPKYAAVCIERMSKLGLKVRFL